MGHGITATDSFSFLGDRKHIWHKLGTEIQPGQKAVEVFRQNGLGWETELLPAFCEFEGQRIVSPDHRVHIRNDTREVLGIVGKDYKVFSNASLARFMDALAEADDTTKLTSCGSLLGGKRVFAALELGTTIRIGREDCLKPYIVGSNGHGGFAGTRFYRSDIRPICQNTLTWSEANLAQGCSFSHVGDVEEKLKQAKLILGRAIAESEVINEQVQAMARTDMSTEMFKHFLEQAFVITFGKPPSEDAEENLRVNYAAKKADMFRDWEERFNNERQTLPGIQHTVWAALNAYTEWADHERGGKWMEARPADHRLHSNLFGVSAIGKRKVLSQALALAR